MQQHRQYPQNVESDVDIGRVGGSLGENDLLDDNHLIIYVVETLIEKMLKNVSTVDAMDDNWDDVSETLS